MSSIPTVTAIVSDKGYQPTRHRAGSAPRRGVCSWHGKPQEEITRSIRLEEHRKGGRRVALYGVCEAARTEIRAAVARRQM